MTSIDEMQEKEHAIGQEEKSASREEEATANGASEQPYSVFSSTRKKWIACAASFAAMFSGLSSFIYYPTIQPLANALDTTVELINLTITSYQIVSGVAPSIIGDMADRTGRRPVYIVAFTIYTAANLGLALQSSYPGLLVLRMVQSAGSSGTVPPRPIFAALY